MLIQQHERDLLSEWPAEQRLILTGHDNKEQRDVCSEAHVMSAKFVNIKYEE